MPEVLSGGFDLHPRAYAPRQLLGVSGYCVPGPCVPSCVCHVGVCEHCAPPLAITHHTRMLGFHLMGMARCRCGSSAISADTSGESDSSSSPGAPNVSSHHPPLENFVFRMCAKRGTHALTVILALACAQFARGRGCLGNGCASYSVPSYRMLRRSLLVFSVPRQ